MKIRITTFVLLTVTLMFHSFNATAQEEDPYKDILFMIIDGDYEKAASKAEKITDKDKTHREPVPYIYASMAYFEMSKDDKYDKDYPRAFRDAIKNAYKAARYDKDNEYMPQHAQYISELKAAIMREARFEFEQQSWRKSITNSKYVTRIDPTDISAILLKGVAEERGRNSYQAKATFEEADTTLKHFSASDISIDAKPAYLYSILKFAELMKEEGTKDRAQPYLDAVADLYGEDPEFKNVYENY